MVSKFRVFQLLGGQQSQLDHEKAQKPNSNGLLARFRKPRHKQSLHLPQELIDYIIDQIWDDFDTLKACSYVSRSFSPRTRYHLFSRLKLTLPVSCRELELVSTLKGSPHLTNCVKAVVVTLQLRLMERARGNVSTYSSNPHPILEMVTLFSNVKALTVATEGAVSGNLKENWDISEDSRSLVSSILGSAPVETLVLHEVFNFDSILISSCSTLTRLELSGGSTLSPLQSNPVLNRRSTPSITTLVLGTSARSLQSLLKCTHSSSASSVTANRPTMLVVDDIRHLDVHEGPWQWLCHRQNLLPLDCLTTFAIRLRLPAVEGYRIPVPEYISLNLLPSITSLEIHGSQTGIDTFVFATRIMNILATVPNPTKLKLISFVHAVSPAEAAARIPADSSSNKVLKLIFWGGVDSALARMQLPKDCVIRFQNGDTFSAPDPSEIFRRSHKAGLRVELI